MSVRHFKNSTKLPERSLVAAGCNFNIADAEKASRAQAIRIPHSFLTCVYHSYYNSSIHINIMYIKYIRGKKRTFFINQEENL